MKLAIEEVSGINLIPKRPGLKMNWSKYYYYDAQYGRMLWKSAGGRGNHRHNRGDLAGCLNDQGYWKLSYPPDGKQYHQNRIVWNMLHPYDVVPEGKYDTSSKSIVINHNNGNRSEDYPWNLSKMTQYENSQPANRKLKNKNNTSGETNICWDKNKNRWLVTVKKDYKHMFISYAATFEEAKKIKDLWLKGKWKKPSVNSNNTSGCKGVSWNPLRGCSGKWHSYKRISGKKLEAYFDDFFEAVCWVKSLEASLWKTEG